MISIQQPEFFPWLGFFDKFRQVDTVVLLDTVQFKKRYFENRNRVLGPNGWYWIRVPVRSKGRHMQTIGEVEIDEDQPWRKRLATALASSYGRAPFWRPAGGEELCALIEGFAGHNLADFNIAIIGHLAERLGVARPLVRASSLGVEARGSDLILALCHAMGARRYLSGRFGRDYLDGASFARDGIELCYQDFAPAPYPQFLGGPFVEGLSAVDMLFNLGPGCLQTPPAG